MTYQQIRTGVNAALVALVVLIVQFFVGPDTPSWVTVLADSTIGVVAIVTSFLFPRWQGNSRLGKHPAGFVGGITIILSIVLPLLFPEITPEKVTLLVGGLVALVALATPSVEPPELDREQIGA